MFMSLLPQYVPFIQVAARKHLISQKKNTTNNLWIGQMVVQLFWRYLSILRDSSGHLDEKIFSTLHNEEIYD